MKGSWDNPYYNRLRRVCVLTTDASIPLHNDHFETPMDDMWVTAYDPPQYKGLSTSSDPTWASPFEI